MTQTIRERTVLHAFLTPEQRDWLDTRPRTMLTKDVVLQFVERFGLTAKEAGKLLTIWINGGGK